MSVTASLELTRELLSVTSSRWGRGNQPIQSELAPELVAGMYMPMPSPEIAIINLGPYEEFAAPCGAVSAGEGSVQTMEAHIKPGQEWFWSEEWQAAEYEAEVDLVEGRFETFDNDEDFLASLV